jgi:hypothetical protein
MLAAAIVALMPGAATAARQVTVAGNWSLLFTGPQGPMEVAASFTQEGEAVSGTIEGPQGTVECTGTLKETKLALSISIDAGGQNLTIYLLGDVDGDAIKGTFSMGSMGSGDWTGKRKN